MKPEEFLELIQIAKAGEGFVFANEKAEELFNNLAEGEVIELQICQNRDIKLHRAYFLLLGYIYDYLPAKFKTSVKKEHFYIFLKYAQNNVKIIFTFKDGRQIVEPISISFAKMDNVSFKAFIKEQLPFIYSQIIGAFYSGEIYNSIIENIEKEFEKILTKLN